MKILIIQHSAADRPAAVGETIDKLGHAVQTVRIDQGEAIPHSVDADLLMMFGGGISLTSTDELPPWVANEQALIRAYVNEGRRVLGICLGSQLLASALGATVRRNAQPEIGWHEVQRVGDQNDSDITVGFPPRMTVLQWHQDTFDIPHGATHLFRSEACKNQAFTIDDRVFGFQFHFEANAKTVATFLAVSQLWKQKNSFIQSEVEITDGIETHLPAQTAAMKGFLAQFLCDGKDAI